MAERSLGWATKHALSLVLILLFAFVFFCLQKLTFLLRFPPHERTTLWAPGALTFAALLISPWYHWWRYHLGLCIGAFAAYYGDPEIPGFTALVSAQFHFISVACGVGVIRQMAPLTPFSSTKGMVIFLLAAGVLVPLATTLPIDFVGWCQGKAIVWPTTVRSFLCVALGMVIATPAFATTALYVPTWFRKPNWKELIEVSALSLGVLMVSGLVFTASVDPQAMPALVYVPIPILLWATIRYEVGGASWTLLAIGYISTASAIQELGPFSLGETDDQVLRLQLFLLALSLPLLIMATVVQERRRSHALFVQENESRRKLEDRFRLVVESTPNAMMIVDSSRKIVLVNQQTERWFGHERVQLIGINFRQLIAARFYGVVLEELGRCIDHPLPTPSSNLECYGVRSNGSEFPIEMSFIRLDDENERLILISLEDLTDRRKAEETRRELIHANRLSTLSELTASIAHEINQPLAAILSNAEAAELLLESSSPQLEELKTILADIRNDDLRASDVIRKLRSLMRRGEIERTMIDVTSLIQDVIAITRAEAQRRGVDVSMVVPSEKLGIFGDRTHLQQVLLNLMANGIEAMATCENERTLIVSAQREDGDVSIKVTDSGPGIPAPQLGQVFDRFYSTKNEGMGIGLAISKSLVEEHGGKIWVTSVVGQGSTFGFQIPNSLDREEQRAKKSVSASG